jgi:hypothetical protein
MEVRGLTPLKRTKCCPSTQLILQEKVAEFGNKTVTSICDYLALEEIE